MLKENLTQLGLSPNEAEAYMFLLKNVKSKASELAKHLEVTHPAAKKILDNLINKELIRQGIYGKTTYYFPESSKNLIKLITKEKEILEKNIEKKLNLANITEKLINEISSLGEDVKTNIKFLKGKEGIKKLVKQIASSTNKTIYELVDTDLQLYTKIKDNKDYIKEYKKNNIKFDVIYIQNNNEPNPLIDADLIKISKKDALNPTAQMLIFDDKVAFAFITDDHTIFLIENKWIANSLKTLFINLKKQKIA